MYVTILILLTLYSLYSYRFPLGIALFNIKFKSLCTIKDYILLNETNIWIKKVIIIALSKRS